MTGAQVLATRLQARADAIPFTRFRIDYEIGRGFVVKVRGTALVREIFCGTSSEAAAFLDGVEYVRREDA